MRTLLPTNIACQQDDFLAWLRDHKVVPEITYKIELNEGAMTVHQYRLDSDGKKFVIREDHETQYGEVGDVAVLEPFTVAIQTPPPLSGEKEEATSG